eukprot:TRINITY_DN1399_c0_g1_i1.p1 TRINITY_DN1399_c0_g1~~TRINITY_DN1399_c0_g1_i1.p1  ORF type:complete len:676 (+),score=167.70 TRINITY_DN1399_c0_g1_i1:67-2094(+)
MQKEVEVGATSASSPSDTGSIDAREELKASVLRAVGREEERMKEFIDSFAWRQQAHLSLQLRTLQEMLVNSLRNSMYAALDLDGDQNREFRITIPSIDELNVPSEDDANEGDSISSEIFSYHDAVQSEDRRLKMSDTARTTSSPVHCVASTVPPTSLEEGSEADRRGPPLRSFTESSIATGAVLWIPSKEATAGAFNQLIEKAHGSRFGVNKVLRKALHKSGINLEQLAAPRTRFPCLLSLVRSRWFACAVLILIALNAVFICFLSDAGVRQAMQDHAAMQSGTERPPPSVGIRTWQEIVEFTFTGLFTVELILRMIPEGCTFWVGPEWQWNVFDAVLVISMITDTVLVLAGENITYIRILRIVRALRSFRMMRVLRFFRELRVMVLSTMNSLAPLMWAMLFLALTISVFSVLFLQGVTSFIRDANSPMTSIEAMEEYYASFPMAFFSLFMAITGGDDWKNIVWPLLDISPVYGFLFMIYISLMVVGVLNIITGIFVESATELSRLDRDLVTQAEQDRIISYIKELLKLFNELDTDKSGTISLHEFEAYAARSDIQAFFSVLELDVSKAAQVFRLLDVDGSNEIEVDEFVMGCMRLKGLAKGVDMESLMLESKKLMNRQQKQQRWNRRRFTSMEKMIEDSQAEQAASLQRLEKSLSNMVIKMERQLHARVVSESF